MPSSPEKNEQVARERALVEKDRRRILRKAGEAGEKALNKLIQLIDSEDDHVARLASRDLLTWVIGKPAQRIEHEGGVPSQIVIVHPAAHLNGGDQPTPIGVNGTIVDVSEFRPPELPPAA